MNNWSLACISCSGCRSGSRPRVLSPLHYTQHVALLLLPASRNVSHQVSFSPLGFLVWPNPSQGGNTIDLPPWKKGWHRSMAPQYARRHFIQQQGAAQVCGLTLCSAAPWIEIFLQ